MYLISIYQAPGNRAPISVVVSLSDVRQFVLLLDSAGLFFTVQASGIADMLSQEALGLGGVEHWRKDFNSLPPRPKLPVFEN